MGNLANSIIFAMHVGYVIGLSMRKVLGGRSV